MSDTEKAVAESTAVDFPFPAVDAKTHVRLLKPSSASKTNPKSFRSHRYTLRAIPLANLSQTKYKILSHEPCHGSSSSRTETILIDDNPVSICQKLFDFLSHLKVQARHSAFTKDEDEYFFIDEICINRADPLEQNTYPLTSRQIICGADEVAVWFGEAAKQHVDGLKKLAAAQGNASDSGSNRGGWQVMPGHGQIYWICNRAVSEVLLAKKLTMHYASTPVSVPASVSIDKDADNLDDNDDRDSQDSDDGDNDDDGKLVFSLSTIENRILNFPPWYLKSGKTISPYATEYGMCAGEGCLDEQLVSRRMRAVLSSSFSPSSSSSLSSCSSGREGKVDPLAQGSTVLTLQEMVTTLTSGPETVMTTYAGETTYNLGEIYSLRPFPSLGKDPRDSLYGILPVLCEKSRARITVDYSLDLSAVFRQALEAGIREICDDISADSLYFDDDDGDESNPLRSWKQIIRYYDDVCDAFHVDDEVACARILRQVLEEMRFTPWLGQSEFSTQWRKQFGWEVDNMGFIDEFRNFGVNGDTCHDNGNNDDDKSNGSGNNGNGNARMRTKPDEPWLQRFHRRQHSAAKSL